MADAEELGVLGIVAAPVFLALRFAGEPVGEFVQLLLELGDTRAVVGREYDGMNEFCPAHSSLGRPGVKLRKLVGSDSEADGLGLFVVHFYLLIP